MAAWLVSKCETPGKREIFVKELRKYLLGVKVFGRCGKMSIFPKDSGKLETYKKLLRPYFFYLSFENTRCNDYISEKFYNVLATKNAIPIVFGPPKENYENIAPPYSFIHIEDFKNAKDLANYLLYLSKNITAYSEYFWWSKYYKVESVNRACETCEFMNKIKNGILKTKKIKDMNEFWSEEKDCYNLNNIPWNLRMK